MNRAGRGRPLRFVSTVGLGWIGARLVLLWQIGPEPGPAGVPAPVAAMPAPPGIAPPRLLVATALPWTPLPATRPPPSHRADSPLPSPPIVARVDAVPVPQPMLGATAQPGMTEGASASPLPEAALSPPAEFRAPHRWQASAWLVARPGQGIGAAPAAGQLGGSQYGIRVVRALDDQGRIAAFGRIAGPLRSRGAEAALGWEWRPGAAPIRLSVEERFGLDGMRGGPGIGLVTWADRAVRGFRLEGYGQTGMILRRRAEPYADGALRFTRPVAQGRAAALAAGIGAWGAVQREVRRLDIGPTVVASLPVGALQTRLAFEWRERVAGDARPGSGPALTLGSDF